MNTMNGKPRQKFECQNIFGCERADDSLGNLHRIFINPCGLTLKTCGNPQKCPKCNLNTLVLVPRKH